MRLRNGLFTSEAVSQGHPDKICDQISDAILDSFLILDPKARVACETVVADHRIFIVGEFKTAQEQHFLDVQKEATGIVKDTLRKIGYGSSLTDIDPDKCEINIHFNRQSEQISASVDQDNDVLGAGDQGMMFGYASHESKGLMPLAWTLATELLIEGAAFGKRTGFGLKPDAKSQVTVEYAEGEPRSIDAVVLSWQHDDSVKLKELREALEYEVVDRVIPKHMRSQDFKIYINKAGRWTIGGPKGDSGLTGRKIIVDTYGGACPHGGGAFSGKDPSKVDRSGAYAARYVAKHVVSSGLAKRCTIQLSYIIGHTQPAAISVDLHGSGMVDEAIVSAAVAKVFDLTPEGIIKEFDLLRPIYKDTAYHGHFGFWRDPKVYLWESTPRISELLDAVNSLICGLKLRASISVF
ncbi:MAG: methionine adenosyltransferase [Alphaproteobacteria bacterium]|mgnify:CR=1 FL=1|nr:methionine adenosyltransferase [Alphaproteobacteria bacterium]OJV47035.1 MAG: methionine adenosyltransferase [Alphaproteobacteria bacterium 43-37]